MPLQGSRGNAMTRHRLATGESDTRGRAQDPVTPFPIIDDHWMTTGKPDDDAKIPRMGGRTLQKPEILSVFYR